jgi:spore coat polysaccharide biosynthesis predicted glycosyltransferase SpsG
MTKVFILTEGSIDVGFGHVSRCTALYQAFEEYGITPTFVVNGDQTIAKFIKGIDIKFINWLKNLDEFIESIKEEDIVIIDSYLADNVVYNKLSVVSNILVCLDDINRLNYPESVIVNGAIDACLIEYKNIENKKLLIGSKYQPLRKAFWESSKKVINVRIQSVFITMGGNDMRNLTPKILNQLCVSYPSIIKHVIIGRAFVNIKEILESGDYNTEFHYDLNDYGMMEMMKKSDVAISASGQTLQELAVTGVPTIGVIVADNQKIIAKSWMMTGFLSIAGEWNDEKLELNILQKIFDLKDQYIRITKSKIGQSLIDGRGCKRIIEFLMNKVVLI